MKVTSCFFACIVIAVLFAFTPSTARADFDISVDSELTDIAFSIGDSTIVIPFKDGVATWVNKEDGSFGIGFYTEASLEKAALSDTVYTISVAGVTPKTGNIYFVLRGTSEKDNTLYAWPVAFSPFGIGIRSSGGKVYHNGLALCGDHALRDMTDNKKLF